MSTATESSTTAVQVVSVKPATVEDGFHKIELSRRSTKLNEVPTAERYRAIVVKAAQLALPDGATISKFSELLQATIHQLADKKFAEWAVENLQATTVEPAMFNLDAVMAYWSEERKSQQVDAAKITDWLKTSKTLAALSKETAAVWLQKVPKIAAPGYANFFSKGQAAAIVSKINEEEIDSSVAAFIMDRCNKIITRESQEEAL